MREGVIDMKVRFLDDACRFEQTDIGDWIDLRCREDVVLFSGSKGRLIPLGVSAELPEGYEAHILPRSSTFKNHGIIMTNSEGIIDNSYRGEWHFAAMNASDHVVHIPKGTRICQFRLERKMPRLNVIEVDELSDSKRGANGFGSTGDE